MLVAAVLGLALVACGGGEEGQDCSVDDDCDDGLICAQIAECFDDDCLGLCLKPCNTDDDCPGDRLCGSQIGSPEDVCRSSIPRD